MDNFPFRGVRARTRKRGKIAAQLRDGDWAEDLSRVRKPSSGGGDLRLWGGRELAGVESQDTHKGTLGSRGT